MESWRFLKWGYLPSKWMVVYNGKSYGAPIFFWNLHPSNVFDLWQVPPGWPDSRVKAFGPRDPSKIRVVGFTEIVWQKTRWNNCQNMNATSSVEASFQLLASLARSASTFLLCPMQERNWPRRSCALRTTPAMHIQTCVFWEKWQKARHRKCPKDGHTKYYTW